jgi:gliding motility-associated protein GldM
MLAAYNKSANPTISSSAGAVPVKDGVGTLKFRASGVGAKTVNGVISIDKAGKKETYPFKFDYIVGTAGASLQLDKMNVMYIGVDNPVTLSASGYNIEDVSLSMAGATVKANGKGQYLVRVAKQGTMEYSINAKTRQGTIAKVGGGKIRAKFIPPPQAEVANTTSGVVKTGVAKVQPGVVATLKGFDFDAPFQVTSFRFVLWPKIGDPVEIDNNGARFTSSVKEAISRSRPGDRWLFENVKAKGPDGRIQPVNSVTITLN